jgi:hypothetical protein
MRLPALVLLALLLAGCAAPATEQAPGSAGPHASLAGWQLDCNLGAFERARNASWAQDCAARASHTAGAKQEIWIAVNPTDPRNVVLGAKDLNPDSSPHCVWNGLAVTHDAGATWKDVVIGGTYADRQPGDPTYGYACNTDPMFAFTRDGALHYGVEMYNLGGSSANNTVDLPLVGGPGTIGWRILLATSHDGGDTWPDVVTYAPETGTLTDDYSRMAVSPRTQTILEGINLIVGAPLPVATGTAADGSVLCNLLSSRDGGKSADPPVEATVVGMPGRFACRGLAASPDGTFVLAFRGPDEGIGNGPELWFAQSTDDGRTWSDAAKGFTVKPLPFNFTQNKFRTGTNFEMAFDLTDGPRRGTLYAVYADEGAGNADVLLRSSADLGKTWSMPVRVNQDNGTNDQWMPNVAVAGDGSVHVLYMDKRWDPADKLIDITHAVSTDGGATWREERVTTRSFDGDLGVHQSGAPFIGDYEGIAASGSDVWLGYPDSSDGRITVTAAAHAHRSSA